MNEIIKKFENSSTSLKNKFEIFMEDKVYLLNLHFVEL